MRLDQLLTQKQLFPSREKAKRAIMAGLVLVDGQRIDKPGTSVAEDASVELTGQAEPFVSRAGRKLAHAMEHFDLAPKGWICLDVGASTGGFTDCLLQQGAKRVYALDVGYGQLDYRLRQDPRVVVMERVNARHLRPEDLPEPCDLITIDVSFISLTKVVPALLAHLAPEGRLLPMIKPQFEARREQVGKGGILRDPKIRQQVILGRVRDLEALGLAGSEAFDSPVAGVGGNREAFALFRHQTASNAEDGTDGGKEGIHGAP